MPGPGSPASCYLVEHEGSTVVLDLGNGALGPLQRHTDIYRLDAVLLSHLHADHCLDMAPYYVALRYHPDAPFPKVPVHAPAGAGARLARAYDLPEDPGMTGEFAFHEFPEPSDERPLEIGPFRITTARMAHPVPCFALRIEAGGRSLVYSGDTGPNRALVDLARGADLALFEASFLDGDNPPALHLSAREAAQHAEEAGVDRLMLTHLVPWNPLGATLTQASAYRGDLLLARSGLSVDV
jgi:ribonuclease BN (tRNA processing enzyme)